MFIETFHYNVYINDIKNFAVCDLIFKASIIHVLPSETEFVLIARIQFKLVHGCTGLHVEDAVTITACFSVTMHMITTCILS